MRSLLSSSTLIRIWKRKKKNSSRCRMRILDSITVLWLLLSPPSRLRNKKNTLRRNRPPKVTLFLLKKKKNSKDRFYKLEKSSEEEKELLRRRMLNLRMILSMNGLTELISLQNKKVLMKFKFKTCPIMKYFKNNFTVSNRNPHFILKPLLTLIRNH